MTRQQQLPQQQSAQQQQSVQQQQQRQQSQLIPQQPQQQSQDDEWFTDEDESVSPAVTTGSPAYVLYDFEAKYPEEFELSVTANDVVMVIKDPGNGWLFVNRGIDSGYIPSTYVQFY